MKRLFVLVVLLASFSSLFAAKAKDVTLRPGDTLYLRFEVGKKLKFVSASAQPDEQAQVIFSLQKDDTKKRVILRVENKLAKDIEYRAEMRSLKYNLKAAAPVTPVVGGKLAIETLAEIVEELTAFDFAYAKYKPAPETPKGG